MHLLVTRPEPDAAEIKARLEAAGHRVSIDPMIEIEYLAVSEAALSGAQALVVTSRNALRALSRTPGAFARARALPTFAVGPETKELALAQGFTNVTVGPGSARELVPVIAAAADPSGGPLVHLSGDHVAFDLAPALATHGLTLTRLVVYKSVGATSFRPETVAEIADRALDGVVLMSAKTAQTYLSLLEAHGLVAPARHLVHFCLSWAVAERLTRLQPCPLEVSSAATSEQMLALIARIARQSGPRSP